MKISFFGHTAVVMSLFLQAHAQYGVSTPNHNQQQKQAQAAEQADTAPMYLTVQIINGFVTLWSSLAQNPLNIDVALENFYDTLNDDELNTEIAKQNFFTIACFTITCMQEECNSVEEQQSKYQELSESMNSLLSKIAA